MEKQAESANVVAQSKLEQSQKLEQTVEEMEEKARSESAQAQSHELSAEYDLAQAAALEQDASAKLTWAKSVLFFSLLLIAGLVVVAGLRRRRVQSNQVSGKGSAGADVESQADYK